MNTLVIDRELLKDLLDCITDCHSQYEGTTVNGEHFDDSWDDEYDRCVPGHKYECGRCYTKRRVEELLNSPTH